jgi:hypothetical protein
MPQCIPTHHNNKGGKIEEGTLFNLLCEVSIALTPKLSKDTIGKPQTTIHAK